MLHTPTTATASHDRRPGRLRIRTTVAVGLATALLLAGCGAGQPAATATASPSVVSATETTDAAPATSDTDATAPAAPALTARADGEVAVFRTPQATTPMRTLPARTGFGTQTVLLVSEAGAGAADGWLEVLLPVRPNGSTGWIRVDDVELRDLTVEVEIDLADRELTVTDNGDELLRTTTAIGDPDHPTPTGRFYVIDKLQTPDPDGAYGPFAMGLSAHSEVLTEFAGGDGQVGIHGTNAPTSIGRPVSHGCLRVDNAVIERLTDLLPLGTPVTIS